MSEKPPKPIEIFYSYSHKDEDLRDELEKHLSILKWQGVIQGWHDRRIGAGTEWEGEIDTHLNTANVILLLISADFLASDYCYDVEMKRTMERHEAGEARVIPVILRPVDWRGALFGKLQALPKDAKPVTSWTNHDEAFLDVAKGIRAAVEELVGSSVGPPSPVGTAPVEPDEAAVTSEQQRRGCEFALRVYLVSLISVILILFLIWSDVIHPAHPTPTAIAIQPTDTPTPLPRDTPTPTYAPTPTYTPMPTYTPTYAPTYTLVPTVTPRPPTAVPPTATGVPPTATPVPTTPPSGSQYQYRLGRSVTCTPNCGTTGVKGVVYDVNANYVPGLIVKVWADGWCCGQDETSTYGPYEILLFPGPKAGHWYVAVYSHDGSTQLSDVVDVYTDSEPCEPSSSGCQWPVVDFVANPILLPAPRLLDPENGAAFIGAPVLLKWQWDRPLAPDEIFSLRVRREGEWEACHHTQVRGLEYFGHLSYCFAGKHYWSVALVRKLCEDCPTEEMWQNLSEPSEERWIYYVPGKEPWVQPPPEDFPSFPEGGPPQ